MTTCAQYRTRLTEAEAALHKLLTGSQVESLRAGEKQLTYTKANIAELRAYISDLKAAVAACDGAASPKRRIVRFIPE